VEKEVINPIKTDRKKDEEDNQPDGKKSMQYIRFVKNASRPVNLWKSHPVDVVHAACHRYDTTRHWLLLLHRLRMLLLRGSWHAAHSPRDVGMR
jgi:hypothetical protein